MFRRRKRGATVLTDALKNVRDDITAYGRETPDIEHLLMEADRRRKFADMLLNRLSEGEMDEKYAEVPDALDKLFAQAAHASLLAETLKLLAAYERARHTIYDSDEG